MTLKLASVLLLTVQIILFVFMTLMIFIIFQTMKHSGGGIFNPPFQSTQFRRLIAWLAPYLVLPISIVVTFTFYIQELYETSILAPVALTAFISIASRVYLRIVPDPLEEHYGPIPSPYPGFLVLPKEAIPPGFMEVHHHYSKENYKIDLEKILGDQHIRVSILQSEGCYFHFSDMPVREFLFSNIVGRVYGGVSESTAGNSLQLIWLNPPKQRTSIFLTQPSNEFTPEDLIDLLKKMK